MSDSPRVLLMHLSCRTSSRGREYLAGYLGCARVVGFKAKEPDKFGHEQWEVYVAEPPQRNDQSPRQEVIPSQRRDLPVRGQGTWDRARERDLPTGATTVYRNERQDPRQQYAEEVAARFEPDTEIPF